MKLSESSTKSKATFVGTASSHSAFSSQLPWSQHRSGTSGDSRNKSMHIADGPSTQNHRNPQVEHTIAQKAALTAHGFTTQTNSLQQRKQARQARRTAANVRNGLLDTFYSLTFFNLSSWEIEVSEAGLKKNNLVLFLIFSLNAASSFSSPSASHNSLLPSITAFSSTEFFLYARLLPYQRNLC